MAVDAEIKTKEFFIKRLLSWYPVKNNGGATNVAV